MILTDILAGAVSPDDPVLTAFVETVASAFIARHALTPAKGSTQLFFGQNHDQSMVAHIFNGLFPAMRLLALADRGRARPHLSDTGQRLLLLGYTMHDLNKLRHLHDDLATGTRAQVEEALALLRDE